MLFEMAILCAHYLFYPSQPLEICQVLEQAFEDSVAVAGDGDVYAEEIRGRVVGVGGSIAGIVVIVMMMMRTVPVL